MRDRVRRIFDAVGKTDTEPVEAIVLAMGVDPHLDLSFFYATDLVAGGLFERSVAILWPDGRVEVLTNALEGASARKAAETEVHVHKAADDKKAWLKERLAGLTRIGVNAPEITLHEYRYIQGVAPDGAELVDVQEGVQNARLIKDARELARMRRAGDIVSRVADKVPELLREGMKEFELAAELSFEMQKRGATGPSFSSIVSFGKTGAEPHYAPGDVELKKGDLVLGDFGALFERYASDLTRTWMFGAGTDQQRGMYDTVLAAQQAALEAVRPGAKGAAVHEAAAAVIDASPFKGRFIHSIGHSLGLAVHDGAVLHPRMDLTLAEGMVITIEPGVYLPEVGGVRIEDDVVVTASGCDLLTDAVKTYREV